MTGRYDGRSALVTGANGFIGSWLARALSREGARKVVAPERARPFPLGALPERCDLIQLDLGDTASIRHVIHEKECDTIFHLAALTDASSVRRDPFAAFEVNVRGTYNLLEACRLARNDGQDVRTVIASTHRVYGRRGDGPVREDVPLDPLQAYEASKACAERLAYCYHATYGMPVAIARLANVYGPGDLAFSRLVPGAARALASGNTPEIRPRDTGERDFIHVRDAVEAYFAVERSLDRRELWGRAWNAGADAPIAVGELVRRLAAASGRPDLEPRQSNEREPLAEPDRPHLDSGAIRDELGWRASEPLDDGLAETYAWYERLLADTATTAGPPTASVR
jgi:CDP-glucose 4,6-dehydratase